MAPTPTASPGANEALAYVRTVAAELKAAGQALQQAATVIKERANAPHQANLAHQASKRALEQAEDLARV